MFKVLSAFIFQIIKIIRRLVSLHATNFQFQPLSFVCFEAFLNKRINAPLFAIHGIISRVILFFFILQFRCLKQDFQYFLFHSYCSVNAYSQKARQDQYQFSLPFFPKHYSISILIIQHGFGSYNWFQHFFRLYQSLTFQIYFYFPNQMKDYSESLVRYLTVQNLMIPCKGNCWRSTQIQSRSEFQRIYSFLYYCQSKQIQSFLTDYLTYKYKQTQTKCLKTLLLQTRKFKRKQTSKSNYKLQKNMEDQSEYQKSYQELELLAKNIEDSSKLFLVRQKNISSNPQYRMAKKIHIYGSNETSQQKLLNQVKLLKDLNNPHILKYYDVCLEDDQLILILEFCQEGDLSHYIQKRKQRKQLLSEKLILSWLLQILMGLQYIHSRNILHRLISTNNIFMNHQGDLKIGSFGAAKVLENTLEKAHTIVGSPCNMSPQIVEGKPYDSKADIWALGCLLYQLCTFESPFKFSNLPQLYNSIVKNAAPQLPIKYTKYVSPIFKKMMKKNPLARPSASQLLQQQVFLNLMKEYTKKKKIDALDLRQIVPKQLATHKKKLKKNPKSTLPPLSSSRQRTINTIQKPNSAKGQQKSDVNANKRNKSNNKKLVPLPLNSSPKPFSKNKEKDTEKTEKDEKIYKSPINSPKTPTKLDTNQRSKGEIKQKLERSKQSSDIQSSQEQQRLTIPNLQQAQYISLLCQIHLEYIAKKYEPKMEQIFERTIQFDDLL